MNSREKFEEILYNEMLPAFCRQPSGEFEVAGFRKESIRVSEVDASDFVRGWRGELIAPTSQPWQYQCPKSSASEMFFWHGQKKFKPRPFTLWLEPVITVAALARLHFDFGWPVHLLGTQPSGWAFDVVAFSEATSAEHILAEVKKSRKEVEVLLEFMHSFGRDPDAPVPPPGKKLNAYKKVVGLRNSSALVFWAVGPEGFHKVFHVKRYGATIDLVAVEESALQFSRPC